MLESNFMTIELIQLIHKTDIVAIQHENWSSHSHNAKQNFVQKLIKIEKIQ